ncbi:glutathione S-transferase family protein [Halopseudomonas nanhaiensis]|uniref:glutathione S-transferase family protein n=1 Tax=Halopseudomonas nanhaiensis TaxID=2830842 RepID=UPI001CBCA8AE|nr:glutathione S-transferase family protein [Halopseudomonas nanhaiensis]UAW99672.1 glutathione S-transferase family protein [Halopseudomonas nanhaiensis]
MAARLYIANKNYSSWSLRPWLLMRELDIPFVEQLMPFKPGASDHGFSTFSPNGKVPCLADGDCVVWDSLAITEYLAESYPQVWPEDREARAWARSATAEMHSGFAEMRAVCTMNCGIRVRLHHVTERLEGELNRLESLWCDGLQRFGGEFLAGPAFTAVDAFFAPVVFRLQTYGLELAAAPANAYARRMLELKGMREWYEAALKESWREPLHEDEARDAGQWLEDLRY